CLSPVERAMTALRCFWRAPIMPGRQMGPEQLLLRGRESAAFVAVTAPACAGAATAIVERLAGALPDSALRPIHGDMKLEHLFMDQDSVTLIDTESVSMGLPDYDLAQLYGRLWQADFEGQLPQPVVEAASTMVREEAGPDFDWCLGIVALRLAKFYAQRPTPGMTHAIMTMLERLR
ncbi:MAG: phosphotransferase, partial [Paracoccaceae bacterium]